MDSTAKPKENCAVLARPGSFLDPDLRGALLQVNGNRMSWKAFLERQGLELVGDDPLLHDPGTLREFWVVTPVDSTSAADVQAVAHSELRALDEKARAEEYRDSRESYRKRTIKSAMFLLRELGPWAGHGFLDRLVQSERTGRESDGELEQMATVIKGAVSGQPMALSCINDSSLLCPNRPNAARWETTPKVRALFEVLDIQARRPNFSGIVFVKRRQTAIWLAELMRRSDQMADSGVRAAAVVGHGQSNCLLSHHDNTSDAMVLKDQHEVLRFDRCPSCV